MRGSPKLSARNTLTRRRTSFGATLSHKGGGGKNAHRETIGASQIFRVWRSPQVSTAAKVTNIIVTAVTTNMLSSGIGFLLE
jgi:hypothetical protein